MVAEIPHGLNHLRMLVQLSDETRQSSEPELGKHPHDRQVISIALAALYEAATCHRHCYGGPHILESLVGRSYNLGCAAYILISRGFYDEALSLIRSIGEISNLISLSVVDKEALHRWLTADRETRVRDFSPAKVRRLLAAKAKPMMYSDTDWYSSLCEKYTHVNPDTKPNLHNAEGLTHVGGMLQPAGVGNALSELANVLGFVAMPVCKYFRFDDLFDGLCGAVESDVSGKPAS